MMLTTRQRSALLRAARDRLAMLHTNYDAAVGYDRDALYHEIANLARGINWLWQQPAVDDAG